jgi:hypothetical protein
MRAACCVWLAASSSRTFCRRCCTCEQYIYIYIYIYTYIYIYLHLITILSCNKYLITILYSGSHGPDVLGLVLCTCLEVFDHWFLSRQLAPVCKCVCM